MVLVISEAVSTSEKLNGKIGKLNNTKQQYIEHNEAVHGRLGVICCLLRHLVSTFYSTAPEPKLRKGKYSLTI